MHLVLICLISFRIPPVAVLGCKEIWRKFHFFKITFKTNIKLIHIKDIFALT